MALRSEIFADELQVRNNMGYVDPARLYTEPAYVTTTGTLSTIKSANPDETAGYEAAAVNAIAAASIENNIIEPDIAPIVSRDPYNAMSFQSGVYSGYSGVVSPTEYVQPLQGDPSSAVQSSSSASGVKMSRGALIIGGIAMIALLKSRGVI